MRLLVDANLSPRLIAVFTAEGHDAVHVHDVGLLSADDVTIARQAAADDRIVVTSDSDFGTLLARTGESTPSVLLLRHFNDATPRRQAEVILAAIASTADELATGCIVTISKGRLRVRSLPIG